MTKMQEPKIVKQYRELFCEVLGENNRCEVDPLVVQAPGGLIVAVDIKKHATGDPEAFGKEIYQRMVDNELDVELVQDGGGLNLVAYLDGNKPNLPRNQSRKKVVGLHH